MVEIVYCKDCKYSTCWRSGKIAEKFGKGRECSIHVINCPDDLDFCSKGEKALKCPDCGKRYNTLSNFCPDCGKRLFILQESEDKDADKKCTYKETGCGSCKRQLDCPIEANKAGRSDKG